MFLIHDPGFSWRPDVAKKLSDETRGRTFELSSEKKLMEAFDQISENCGASTPWAITLQTR